MNRSGARGEKSVQIVGWAFDARGRAQIRVTEEGKDGMRSERVVALQLSDVPGAAAAFERLRSLLDPRVSESAGSPGSGKAP